MKKQDSRANRSATRAMETHGVARSREPIFAAVLAVLGFVLIVPGRTDELGDREKTAFFDAKVHPILEEHCYKCHGGREKLKANLRLTSREGLLHGGDQGPAIDPENPDRSLILEMISYKDSDHEMPPSGKLSSEAVSVLRQWVQLGAPFNPDREIRGHDGEHEPEASGFETEINEKTRNYWAFKPVGTPIPPDVEDPDWARNPIDAYIFSKLAERGLEPAPPATRQQWIRRATYDLTGLPPSPEEIRAFEADRDPDAYGEVIERLLSSPQYGEKWGRHWLDLVRYAETNGYERDGNKPHAWRYRDYVIDAFNRDKPYDRFVLEQIAGDELDDASPETLVATGYQRLGIWDDEPVDPDQAYYDSLDDVLGNVTQVFLGLTVNCARCHDHKIDPIPQRDYYRMLGFFHNTLNNIKQGQFKKSAFTLNTTAVIASEEEKRRHERQAQALREQIKNLEDIITGYERKVAATFSDPEKEDAADAKTRRTMIRDKREAVLDSEELKAYIAAETELAELKKTRLPDLPHALTIRENGADAPETFVLIRGNAHVKGDPVKPGYPEVLGFEDPIFPEAVPGADSSGRRRVLAEWIVRRDNPLTARVMANRIWQFHFGRGIVRSPNNFGQIGERPTHPELLDWLARFFMDNGWSIKEMHRQIMLSRTYQMSSSPSPAGLEADPENNLFWRFNMRRLTAEEMRDSVLNLTGTLNLEMGGASIFTEVPADVLATASRPDHAWGNSPDDQQARRSVYVFVKRSLHEPILQAFDFADTDSTCAVRFATTVPTQSLTMLNSHFINSQAELMAKRLRREAGDDVRQQVRRGLFLAMNRPPAEHEIEDGIRMIRELTNDLGLSRDQALDRFCLLALNLNEFVFLD